MSQADARVLAAEAQVEQALAEADGAAAQADQAAAELELITTGTRLKTLLLQKPRFCKQRQR